MPDTYSLPDGLIVWAPNRFEAQVLHREMFVERSYFRHGISLRDDAAVVDVGANIGMFGLYIARNFPRATIHMLEPVPSTFELLEMNVGGLRGEIDLHLHNVGLAAEPGSVTFQVDPKLSFAASMRTDVVEGSRRDVRHEAEWAEAVLLDLPRTFPGSRLAQAAAAALKNGLTRRAALTLVSVLLKLDSRAKAGRVKEVECRVMRLSDFLREQVIKEVDLLKIDVEGAELEVIEGLPEADWPRIKQIVAEVHDIDGRAEQLRSMLRTRGYDVVTEPEEWAVHRLLGITTLFARRASSVS